MRKISFIMVIVACIFLVSGCGSLYTNVKTPMPTLEMQVNADDQAKVGTASATAYLWVVVVGDCSVASAMKQGGITKIHHVDTDINTILGGLYGKFTTVVYGE
ncbi:MAG: TRL-like family protein [Deltaproteobacteria bacterium]|jgi:hypothetical protein|nr:TRL-like family protein [Deltaproteobacteria bacterium]